jgi:putative spermidine/putrescine transport system permease protein
VAVTLKMTRLCDDAMLVLVLLMVAATVAFFLMPLIVLAALSFDNREYLAPFPPDTWSLRWYAKFFSERYYLAGLRTSILTSGIATLISSVLGVSAAVVIDRHRFRGKELVLAFFLSPLAVPSVVVGFALLNFYSRIGIFDGFARLIGGHVLMTIPFIVRATLASLAGIPRSLPEAALALGATERQAFWEVTFPLARTGIIGGAIVAFAFSFDDVSMSLFLSDPKAYTLPVAMVSMMRSNFDLAIAAASMLFVAITILIVIMLDRIVGLDRIIGQGMYRS